MPELPGSTTSICISLSPHPSPWTSPPLHPWMGAGSWGWGFISSPLKLSVPAEPRGASCCTEDPHAASVVAFAQLPSAKVVPEGRADTGTEESNRPINSSLLALLGHLWADTSSPGCPRASALLAVFYSASTHGRCSSHFTQRRRAQGDAGLP